eukprot:scaffold36955_cov69-Phaeocystis_antarctica.AAC.1
MPAIAPPESPFSETTTADSPIFSSERGGGGGGGVGRTVSIVLVAALTVGTASTVTPRAVDNAAVESVVSLAAAATAVDVESVTVATTLTLPAVTAMATWHSGALHPR